MELFCEGRFPQAALRVRGHLCHRGGVRYVVVLACPDEPAEPDLTLPALEFTVLAPMYKL